MTELHIPAHLRATMLSATQEHRAAAEWANKEDDLKRQLDEHQAAAHDERTRIKADLEERANKAQARFDQLAAEEKRIAAELADAARRKEQHAYEADDARHVVQDWCMRHSVDPNTLPPISDSGPLPVIDDKALALGQQLARPEQGSDLTATRIDVPMAAGTVDPRPELPGGDPADDGGFQGDARA